MVAIRCSGLSEYTLPCRGVLHKLSFALQGHAKKLNFLIFLYLGAFKISCSAELSMELFNNLGAQSVTYHNHINVQGDKSSKFCNFRNVHRYIRVFDLMCFSTIYKSSCLQVFKSALLC